MTNDDTSTLFYFFVLISAFFLLLSLSLSVSLSLSLSSFIHLFSLFNLSSVNLNFGEKISEKKTQKTQKIILKK